MVLKFTSFQDVRGLLEITQFIGDVYNKNSRSLNKRNFMLCQRFSKNSQTLLISMASSYAFGLLMLLMPGFYTLCMTGVSAPPLRISSLFFDQNSAFDLIFEWIVNVIEVVITFYVQFTFDILMNTIFLNMLLVSSIIAGHLTDLKVALLNPNTSEVDAKYRLQAITLMILKYKL